MMMMAGDDSSRSAAEPGLHFLLKLNLKEPLLKVRS